MKYSILLLAGMLSGAAQAGPDPERDFSVTCTLTEKRLVTGGMLVGTGSAPQRVEVHFLDGGFVFKYKGIMYSSPRLDDQGVATTPEGQQYIYSKDDRAFSVADGEMYLELSNCSAAAPSG